MKSVLVTLLCAIAVVSAFGQTYVGVDPLVKGMPGGNLLGATGGFNLTPSTPEDVNSGATFEVLSGGNFNVDNGATFNLGSGVNWSANSIPNSALKTSVTVQGNGSMIGIPYRDGTASTDAAATTSQLQTATVGSNFGTGVSSALTNAVGSSGGLQLYNANTTTLGNTLNAYGQIQPSQNALPSGSAIIVMGESLWAGFAGSGATSYWPQYYLSMLFPTTPIYSFTAAGQVAGPSSTTNSGLYTLSQSSPAYVEFLNGTRSSGNASVSSLVSGTTGTAYVVTTYGSNEAYSGSGISTSQFLTYMHTLWTTVHGYGANVKCVNLINPCGSGIDSTGPLPGTLNLYYNVLRSQSTYLQGSGASYPEYIADLGAVMSTQTDGNVTGDPFCADGIHPTPVGAKFMAALLANDLLLQKTIPESLGVMSRNFQIQATNSSSGGVPGTINMNAGTSGNGGIINTSGNTTASGGSIQTQALLGNNGGTIDTAAGVGGAGGNIATYGGSNYAGGHIYTFAGSTGNPGNIEVQSLGSGSGGNLTASSNSSGSAGSFNANASSSGNGGQVWTYSTTGANGGSLYMQSTGSVNAGLINLSVSNDNIPAGSITLCEGSDVITTSETAGTSHTVTIPQATGTLAIITVQTGTLSSGTATFTVPSGCHPWVQDTASSPSGPVSVATSGTTATVHGTGSDTVTLFNAGSQ